MHAPGPLDGVKILDLTHVLAGPFATMILSDLGAEVIKVEFPGRGDSIRLNGPPFQNGESAYFMCVNRNKRSIAIDLKRKEGAALIKELVRDSDIVIESFRPRVMKKLGLDYETLQAIKPDLIYASLSAFGRSGPYVEKPGFELIIQGLSGLISVTTEPGRRPHKIQIQVVDLCAGMFLAIAVLGAIHHKEKTGQGQRVDTSLLESTMAMMANLAGIYFMTGRVPVGMGTRNPQIMPSQALKTADSYVTVVTQPQHWERFCQALGKPEWAADERLNKSAYRVEHYEQVEKMIEEVTTTKTTGEWLELFEKYEIAAGPMNHVEDMFEDPQVRHIGMVETVDHPVTGPVKLLRQPWRLSATPGGIRRPPPRLGEHTIEILRERGFSPQQIGSLAEKGIIQAQAEEPEAQVEKVPVEGAAG